MPQLSQKLGGVLGCAGLCAMLVFMGSTVFAAQDNGALAQSFQASDTLEAGTLVGLQQNKADTVEASNTERVNQLIGVVADKPLIELSGGSSTISVVTSGVAQTLVSDMNGSVKTGDKITASPINGVGMKAIDSVLIVGTAQDDLDNTKATTRTINDRDGKPHQVRIGLVPVQVNVTFYGAPGSSQSYIPTFLQDAANAIAGKQVSPVRVLASLLLAILALVSVTILLYSSVRSSLISIGRNPLSEKAIHKGLIEVGAVILGILLLTFAAVYLIMVFS
jgi:hypothetical protein